MPLVAAAAAALLALAWLGWERGGRTAPDRAAPPPHERLAETPSPVAEAQEAPAAETAQKAPATDRDSGRAGAESRQPVREAGARDGGQEVPGIASPAEPGGAVEALGKPVADFEIEHELGGTPSLGVPLAVRLRLRPGSPMRDVSVRLSADEGLELDPSDAALSAASATRNSPAKWDLTVLPLREGMLHLRVYAEGMLRGDLQGRSIQIPIRVGEAKPARQAGDRAAPLAERPETPAEDARSTPLIRLPASEPP